MADSHENSDIAKIVKLGSIKTANQVRFVHSVLPYSIITQGKQCMWLQWQL